MAFSQFTLKLVKEKLGLEVREDQHFFPVVEPVAISGHLQTSLDRFTPLALAINTEKARSEWIIAPILGELRELANRQISLFSGISLSVDGQRGLEGFCDFLIGRTPEQYYLAAPVMAVIEAKKEDLIAGLGQCFATMYGVALFNEKENNDIPCVYGAVTSGTNWKFLKLEGDFGYIDIDEYYLSEIEQLMGILVGLVKPQEQLAAKM